MTALFPDPVRATRVRGEDQVLLVGVVALTDTAGAVSASDVRLIINDGTGSLELASISDVATNWRYGTIPDGPKAGRLGWYDYEPDEEAPVNPVDEVDEPD